MLNMIKAEWYKMRKNRIFYVCGCLVILSAFWILYKDMILTAPPNEISNWIQSINVVCSLFLSIASGFVITFLVQREYEDKTLINILAAPTSRTTFILSKFMIWAGWYLLMLGISMAIYIIGGKLIYPGRFGANEIILLLSKVAKGRILSFVASSPLLLVAIMQRRTFYPALMCALAFTGVELFALMPPIKIASMIPWSAAMLFGYGITREYTMRATITILASGIIGVLGACIIFRRQNQ